MSRIEELIRELCPDGVQSRQLRDVARYSDTRITAADVDSKSFVGVDNLLPNKGGKVDSRYLPNATNLTAYEVDDVLVGNIRPYLKKIWLATTSGGCSGDVLAIRLLPRLRGSIDAKYLYYLLSSDSFFASTTSASRGAKMPRGNKKSILNYRVQVPPLEIQRETIRILDTLTGLETGLEADLEAELEARRLQHACHRCWILQERLLNEPRSKLRDIAEFRNARAHERFADPNGDISLLTSRFISTRGKSVRFVKKEDVLSPAWAGETALVMSDLPNGRALARAFYVDADGKYAANQRVCLLRVHDRKQLLPRFLYHIVDRNPQLLAWNNGVDQTHLKKDWILNINIPVPSLDVQAKIVTLLDELDSSVEGLSTGLSGEIEARRQQYEYYRDQLLTFKEKA